MRIRHLLLTALPIVVVACDEHLKNASFDLWCGQKLCDWDLETGQIQRVPTWHDHDYGVKLSGNAAISQHVDGIGAKCLELELVGDFASEQEVSLELDYFDDGSVEDTQRFPGTHWEKLRFTLSVPDVGFHSGDVPLRVRVKKNGKGAAVLARLQLRTTDECASDPPELYARPEGFRCEHDDQCREDLSCAKISVPDSLKELADEMVCGECKTDSDSDCDGDQVCGHKAPAGFLYRACIAPGSSSDETPCQSDTECAGGLCCARQCSSDAECPQSVANGG